jgi:hypothetical protein
MDIDPDELVRLQARAVEDVLREEVVAAATPKTPALSLGERIEAAWEQIERPWSDGPHAWNV